MLRSGKRVMKISQIFSQRAGCFFMKKKYEWSLNDYNSVLNRYPGNERVLSGIKDVKRKM
jgi:hypothetical protein